MIDSTPRMIHSCRCLMRDLLISIDGNTLGRAVHDEVNRLDLR